MRALKPGETVTVDGRDHTVLSRSPLTGHWWLMDSHTRAYTERHRRDIQAKGDFK